MNISLITNTADLSGVIFFIAAGSDVAVAKFSFKQEHVMTLWTEAWRSRIEHISFATDNAYFLVVSVGILTLMKIDEDFKIHPQWTSERHYRCRKLVWIGNGCFGLLDHSGFFHRFTVGNGDCSSEVFFTGAWDISLGDNEVYLLKPDGVESGFVY